MTQRRRKIMKTLPLLSLLLTMYVLTDVAGAVDGRCPRYCLCYFEPKTDMRMVSCVAKRLDNIDLSIPKRVQSLDLSNNSISVLEDRTFQNYGLMELVSLVIRHNLIQTIGLHSFAGLSRLQALDLTDNSLYQILPWTFHDNSELTFLSLSENPLGHISHPGPLLDVPSLEILLLSKCNFAHFPQDAFLALPNLKILDLSHNQLIDLEVYPLQFLHNLQELDISSNPWQCNTNMQVLKSFFESQSSRLVGSSCETQEGSTTQKSKFEKIISVGVAYPEYDDENTNEGGLEFVSDMSEKQIFIDRKCNVEGRTSYEQLIISPTILCLVSFQFGVCATLFIGYFYKCWCCKRYKQSYQPLEPSGTEPTTVILPVQEVRETISCPETPPPTYRELFRSQYP